MTAWDTCYRQLPEARPASEEELLEAVVAFQKRAQSGRWLSELGAYPDKGPVFFKGPSTATMQRRYNASLRSAQIFAEGLEKLRPALSQSTRQPTPTPGETFAVVGAGGWCDRKNRQIGRRCAGCGVMVWHPEPCDSTRCRACYSRVRGRRHQRGMQSLGGAPLAVFVITTPDQLRPFIGPAQCRALSAMWRSVVRSWAFQVWGIEVGGRDEWHPTGENEEPDEFGITDGTDWKPHWNALVPLMGIEPAQTGPGRVVRVRGLVPAPALHLLRCMVQVVLEEVAVNRGARQPEALKANAFYEFRATRENTAHAISYFLRHFPAWRDAWGTSTDHIPYGRAWGILGGRFPNNQALASVVAYARAVASAIAEPKEDPCPCCEGTEWGPMWRGHASNGYVKEDYVLLSNPARAGPGALDG